MSIHITIMDIIFVALGTALIMYAFRENFAGKESEDD